jgi:hypothetical protein
MWFGTGVHVALATYYKSGVPPDNAFERWFQAQLYHLVNTEHVDQKGLEKLEGFRALGHVMLDAYEEYARKNDNWEIIGVEEELRYEVSPGKWIVGTVDLLIRDKTTQKLWVVDHKTCASFIDPQALEFDDQMVLYLWMVWKVYNEVPGGAIYSMLRKKIPADPYLLKNGTLSKARDIDTTYDIYLSKINSLGLDPDDYADVLERLKYNEFFRREYLARSKRELSIFDDQILAEVEEMTRPDVPVFPTMTQDCLWSCRYRDICRTRLTGGDVEYAIRSNYKVVTDYDARFLEIHPRDMMGE